MESSELEAPKDEAGERLRPGRLTTTQIKARMQELLEELDKKGFHLAAARLSHALDSFPHEIGHDNRGSG